MQRLGGRSSSWGFRKEKKRECIQISRLKLKEGGGVVENVHFSLGISTQKRVYTHVGSLHSWL